MRRLTCLLALLLGPATIGCKSSSPGSNPDASVVPTCSSDAECATGFRCDRENRQCVCTGDDACPSGQFCNAFTGLCVETVAGCTSDAQCPGQYCERSLRSCKPITGVCGKCRTDPQCGANSKCAAHPDFPTAGTFCSPLCVGADGGSGGCPGGLTCRGTICVPVQGACGVTNACVPDTLAICTKDADCTDATQQCDLKLQACVAKNRFCPAGDA